MGRGETIGDTAKVLSRYVDCIMYRAYRHDMMTDLAKNSSVPVINALDDIEHPCQALADLLTIKEHKGIFHGLKCAYIGDGNNVCNSLMLGAAMVGMDFVAGCPKGYQPEAEIALKAKNIAKNEDCSIEVISSPQEAAENADILYTDVWVSMGQEDEQARREEILKPYQINSALLAKAKKDCLVMHCLPAHRELEITSEVIDGKNSVVFDQAENRMHVQKALLLTVIKH
jgi:ornithine carbamoyltransferase